MITHTQRIKWFSLSLVCAFDVSTGRVYVYTKDASDTIFSHRSVLACWTRMQGSKCKFGFEIIAQPLTSSGTRCCESEDIYWLRMKCCYHHRTLRWCVIKSLRLWAGGVCEKGLVSTMLIVFEFHYELMIKFKDKQSDINYDEETLICILNNEQHFLAEHAQQQLLNFTETKTEGKDDVKMIQKFPRTGRWRSITNKFIMTISKRKLIQFS